MTIFRSRFAIFGVADQMFVAASSFLLVVGVARTAGVGTMGSFLLVQACHLALLGLFRAVVAIGIVLPEARRVPDPRRLHSGALALALTVGCLSSCGIVAAAVAADPEPRAIFIAFASGVVGAYAMEALRGSSMALGRPLRSAAASLFVLLVLGTAVCVQMLGAPLGSAAVVALWAGASSSVALVWALLAQLRPNVRAGQEAFRLIGAFGRGLAQNQVAVALLQVVTPTAVGLSGSLASVSGLRGSQALLGLPMQISQGLQMPVTRTWGDTKGAHDLGLVRTRWLSWAATQVSSMAFLGLPLLVMPDNLGVALLGDSWPAVEASLPLVIVGSLFGQVHLGSEMILRVRGRAVVMAKWRLAMVVPTILLAAIGAAVDGTRGGPAGLIIANLVLLIGGVRLVRRSASERFVEGMP